LVPKFTLADQLFFDQVREQAVTNEQIRQAAEVNTIENCTWCLQAA